MKFSFLFFISLVLVFTPIISAPFGYDNPTLPSLSQELFDDKPSGYYMPNNKSVFGNFSFNGGWENNGLSIIDGDIYARTGFFFNISSLNVTKQNLTILEDAYFNGKVGIGTMSPDTKLELGSGVIQVPKGSASNPSYSFEHAGAGQVGIYSPTSNTLAFSVNGVERVRMTTSTIFYGFFELSPFAGSGDFTKFSSDTTGLIMNVNHPDAPYGYSFKLANVEKVRIDNTGNVGIGTTILSEKLHVAGNLFLQNDSDKIYLGQGKDVSISYTGTNTTFTNEVGSGAWIFDSGNVGIGTTSPAQVLDVNGVTQATRFISDITTAQNSVAYSVRSNAGNGMFGPAQDVVAFATDDVERMRIDSSGNVGIGIDNPGDPLSVLDNNDNSFVARFEQQHNTGFGVIIIAGSAGGDSSLLVQSDGSANNLFQVRGDGDVIIEKGNVGIGTISPTFRTITKGIEIADSNVPGLRLDASEGGTSGTPYLEFEADRPNDGQLIGSISWHNNNVVIGSRIEGIRGSSDTKGELAFSTSATRRIYIDEDGNVGIGTTTPQNKLNVIGSINQTQGNLTGSFISGFKSGHDAGITAIDTQGVYFNLTNFTDGEFNGISSFNNETMVILIAGLYDVSSQFSFTGTANTEYHLALGINGVRQMQCHAERKMGTGNDVGSASYTCDIRLAVGDLLTGMVENVDSTADITIDDFQLKVWRKGN